MPSDSGPGVKPNGATTLSLLTKTVTAVLNVPGSTDGTVDETSIRASLESVGQVRRLTIRDQ